VLDGGSANAVFPAAPTSATLVAAPVDTMDFVSCIATFVGQFRAT
ncbi:hypothetical protein A2U01_0084247, partial [Trifolium medium]|nr:hypothetical protein [Trifolium medium]